MFAGRPARPHYERLLQRFTELTEGEFYRKRDLAELTLLRQGVTFTVYNDAQGTERIFPFDLIPRIISTEEWKKIERGLEQRITALNLFLHDIFTVNPFCAMRDSERLRLASGDFRPEFMHFSVPQNIYIHICGSVLVRDRDGNFLVLETRAARPAFPTSFKIGRSCAAFLQISSPNIGCGRWKITARNSSTFCDTSRPQEQRVPLSCSDAGIHNSAYYEHSFLARSMGIEIVEARDLIAAMGKFSCARPKATAGRRHLSPDQRRFSRSQDFSKRFRVGVPGESMPTEREMSAWRIPSDGIADEKAIYHFARK